MEALYIHFTQADDSAPILGVGSSSTSRSSDSKVSLPAATASNISSYMAPTCVSNRTSATVLAVLLLSHVVATGEVP